MYFYATCDNREPLATFKAMKLIIIFFISISFISCSKKIEVEKIGKDYFGDFSYSIDTIGENNKYLLNSYEINIWAAHTEYFNGIIQKRRPSVIYKLKIQNNLQPRIINDSLALVNDEFYLTKDNGCWIERYKFDSHRPIYDSNNEIIKRFKNQTERLNKGIYFLKNGNLVKVKEIDKIGIYFLTKHSRGVEHMISMNELIEL